MIECLLLNIHKNSYLIFLFLLEKQLLFSLLILWLGKKTSKKNCIFFVVTGGGVSFLWAFVTDFKLSVISMWRPYS